jgi:hypothetical protein
MPIGVWGQSKPATPSTLAAVRHVRVLGSGSAVEIEIESSDHLTPQAQVLTGPDRLVVDFPNALPGKELRNQAVNRGEVKDVRVGIFTANPPVTRIVLDLSAPQAYQLFPTGHSVIVKVGGPNTQTAGAKEASTAGGLLRANYARSAPLVALEPMVAMKPALTVSFSNGLLSVESNKASLSEILFAIHQRTGADIAVPAGAEQEKVVVSLGPAPAPEVLASLLNGSRFNFMILSAPDDPSSLKRVVLSPRGDAGAAGVPLPAVAAPQDSSDADSDPDPRPQVRAEAQAVTAPPSTPPPAGTPAVTGAPPEPRPEEPTESPD